MASDRPCGFCGNRGPHAPDCTVGEIRSQAATLEQRHDTVVEAVPPAYKQYARSMTPDEVAEVVENNEKWKARPELMLDWLLEQNMTFVQVLQRMALEPGIGRTGPTNQRKAIEQLMKVSQTLVPLLQGALEKTRKAP